MKSSLNLVTGKGGVGKTRLSLLLAQANRGLQLAEISEGLMNEAKKLGVSEPSILRFSRAELAEIFLKDQIKSKFISHLLGSSEIFQNLLQLAPNLTELLMFANWIAESKNQQLLIDAPSTGNFLAYFEAVKTARKLFSDGSLRKMADQIEGFLQSDEAPQIILVSIPERSSLEESLQIYTRLKDIYPKILWKHYVNRMHLAPPCSPENIPAAWRAIAFDRSKNERKRLDEFKSLSLFIDQELPEAARTLG